LCLWCLWLWLIQMRKSSPVEWIAVIVTAVDVVRGRSVVGVAVVEMLLMMMCRRRMLILMLMMLLLETGRDVGIGVRYRGRRVRVWLSIKEVTVAFVPMRLSRRRGRSMVVRVVRILTVVRRSGTRRRSRIVTS
jgi:hypothetical protein